MALPNNPLYVLIVTKLVAIVNNNILIFKRIIKSHRSKRF